MEFIFNQYDTFVFQRIEDLLSILIKLFRFLDKKTKIKRSLSLKVDHIHITRNILTYRFFTDLCGKKAKSEHEKNFKIEKQYFIIQSEYNKITYF